MLRKAEHRITEVLGMQGVWASKFNERAMLSMRKVGLDFRDLRMAVVVQVGPLAPPLQADSAQHSTAADTSMLLCCLKSRLHAAAPALLLVNVPAYRRPSLPPSTQTSAGLPCPGPAAWSVTSVFICTLLMVVQNFRIAVQRVVPAAYAFVIHTHNPTNNSAEEVFAEVVLGLGESIVSGLVPGSALSFKAPKSALDKPQVPQPRWHAVHANRDGRQLPLHLKGHACKSTACRPLHAALSGNVCCLI